MIFPAQEFPISYFQVLAAKSRQKATADFPPKQYIEQTGWKIVGIKIYWQQNQEKISSSNIRSTLHWLVNILASLEFRGGWGGMTVMFADHSPASTSYGALYVILESTQWRKV